MQPLTSQPKRENLLPINDVWYSPRASVVHGLDLSFQKEQRVVVNAHGLVDRWYWCKNIYEAEEILKKYHSGEYLGLEWFTEN